MRVSCTTLETYRLWRNPEQEWMPEGQLLDAIRGTFVPTHNVNLGQAFGKVLEDPDRYRVPGGFQITVNRETFEFGRDVMEPCVALIDYRGIFEAKAVQSYDGVDVASKADHLVGAALSEFKTTLGSFDAERYMDSYQWRFMADAFKPLSITYQVFRLAEATTGVISLRGIETLPLYPYPALHEDCAALVREFAHYVTMRGLDGMLRTRQEAA